MAEPPKQPSDGQPTSEPDVKTSAAPPDDGIGLRDRFGLFGWARGILVVVGLAVLALGMLNAWRSEASTTLLIVGALLALAALLFGPDLREIQLSHGESSARILRGVDLALERVERESPNEELRRQIAEVRGELEQVTSATRAEERRKRAAAATLASLPFPDSKPRTSHTFGSASVTLSLRVSAKDSSSSYTCVVVPPHGTRWTKSIDGPLIGGTIPWTYSAVYPDEFVGSGPLAPGDHQVEWRRGRVPDRQPGQAGVSDLAAA